MRILYSFADASAAGSAMRSVVDPLVTTLSVIAALVCAGYMVSAGIHYMTSSGQPQRLARAKKIMRDALIGLVVVLGAATLTAILSQAYGAPPSAPAEHLPALGTLKEGSGNFNLVDVLIKAITGVLSDIVQTIGKPVINALAYFTSGTPLMAENGAVFRLWLVLLAIADALFVLVLCLLGFNVMSASTLGLDELDFKHLLPQIGLAFLLMNSSIFAIDVIIQLSNGMINALHAGLGNITPWQVLSEITNSSASMGLAALLVMVVFLVLAFILLVYYVGRLVTLYLGAVLAPIIMLIWLMPSFKDFASSAIKTYLVTIFVLFVHVVILLLAASIFSTLVIASPNNLPDPLMALVVGLSTLVALLKTQGLMTQLSYASIGPKTARKLGSHFANGLSHLSLRRTEVAGYVASKGSV
jgi:hypothetical protein